jgi:hypothetical protein
MDIQDISPSVPIEVINSSIKARLKYVDWNEGEGAITYPELPVSVSQKWQIVVGTARILAKIPEPIRPSHPAKKDAVAEFTGNLTRNFPELSDITDEELEEAVRSAKSNMVE